MLRLSLSALPRQLRALGMLTPGLLELALCLAFRFYSTRRATSIQKGTDSHQGAKQGEQQNGRITEN